EKLLSRCVKGGIVKEPTRRRLMVFLTVIAPVGTPVSTTGATVAAAIEEAVLV
ncbi:hypothetical protein ACLOJK_008299, partial [Asimina triloba]